jgi:poly-gamma-glutamate synthesis protein (capsule biosynthesis protein)
MQRKFIFYISIGILLCVAATKAVFNEEITGNAFMLSETVKTENNPAVTPQKISNRITLFMCGDVMTGRGIDQVLPYPSDPLIHESYMKNAGGYIKIAEKVNGPIRKPVSVDYIWGDALEEFDEVAPDVKIINLETSITRSNDYWKGKGIHYRMHPENVASLTVAKINHCSLANNHILDWGYSGLLETLESLKKANINIAGAGRNLREAEAPSVMKIAGKGRVIVFSFGFETSGIPSSWAATENRSGVNLLKDFSDNTLTYVKKKVQEIKRKGDIVVASIHWGSNWGYDVAPNPAKFAHGLIDEAGVDIIHGHSSHHFKAIEIYKDRLILYGCGDFLNDYEGIDGYKAFRADLALMYFATVDASTGKLLGLRMTPTQIRRFKINRASRTDALWVRDTLNGEGAKFGSRVKLTRDNRLTLHWDP